PRRDVDHRVDLDEVPDLDAVGDVRLLADDAVVPERRGRAHVDVVPEARAGADPHPVLDDGGRMNARRVSGGALAHARALRRTGASDRLPASTDTHPPLRSERDEASTPGTVRQHSP